jgi:hypothetical protein
MAEKLAGFQSAGRDGEEEFSFFEKKETKKFYYIETMLCNRQKPRSKIIP